MAQRVTVISDHHLRPRKADGGHSIVRSRLLRVAGHMAPRSVLYCECGKRMSGWGDRARYAYGEHLRRVALTPEGVVAPEQQHA